MRHANLIRWLVASIAFLPMLAVYIVHFALVPEGAEFSGFIHYDQLSYMAYARQVFEDGFSPFYGLPFTYNADTPRIYFQPQILLLGLIWRATGIDPGHLYVLFGVGAGVVMFRLAISLVEQAGVMLRARAGWLTCAGFLWGGGLLWIPGLLAILLTEQARDYTFVRKALFAFDPFFGYWFLNLGRNVFFAVEAYYHSLFLAAVLLVLRKRYAGALLVAAILSTSHPFTGIELLLVLLGFCGAEIATRRQDRPPHWFSVGIVFVVVVHCGYYLFALDWLSADHQALHRQWALPWTIDVVAIMLGYGLVGVIALLSLLRAGLAVIWRDRSLRFFLIWFVVCLGLVKHDLLIPPIQPAHFTRGYVWMPLFLLAAPLIQRGFAYILGERDRSLLRLRAAAVLLVLLSDNLLWFGRSLTDAALGYPGARFADGKPIYVTDDARAVFRLLTADRSRGDLVVSNDASFEYLAVLYTPLRAWRPHPLSTPHVTQREQELTRFLEQGIAPAEWTGRRVFVIIDSMGEAAGATALLLAHSYRLKARIGRYEVLQP